MDKTAITTKLFSIEKKKQQSLLSIHLQMNRKLQRNLTMK